MFDAPITSKTIITLGKSISNSSWLLRDSNERDELIISQRFDVPIEVASVISNRGISLDKVENFLNPSLKHSLPDPSVFAGMDEMMTVLGSAIIAGDKIAIFGDYDVDGATSTALLVRYLNSIGIETIHHIPDRETEGYGPNIIAFNTFYDDGAKLIICVDCATMSLDVLEQAHNKGMRVCVIDHHMTSELPICEAIVNPNRLDDTSGFGETCAVGMVFCVLVGLNRHLLQQGLFDNVVEPNLLQYLDLVALGTVCDVMPLTGLNRSFVKQGLKVLSNRRNSGLKALSDIAGVSEKISAYHLGFVLGPRLNAGGRMGDPRLATSILISNDDISSYELAKTAHALNTDRQQIEIDAFMQAEQNVLSGVADFGGFICVCGDNWVEGIIGIVAGRLKEKYNKPVIVINFSNINNSMGKGSCRSVSSIDIGTLIVNATKLGILQKGGGHKMAAGLSIDKGDLESFIEFLKENISNKVLKKTYSVDKITSISGLNVSLCKKLSMLEPFGVGNSEPKYILKDILISSAKIVGESHISFYVKDAMGGGGIKGICFKCMGTPLGDAILNMAGGSNVQMLGKVKLDTWNGNEKVQFMLDDLAI